MKVSNLKTAFSILLYVNVPVRHSLQICVSLNLAIVCSIDDTYIHTSSMCIGNGSRTPVRIKPDTFQINLFINTTESLIISNSNGMHARNHMAIHMTRNY